MIAITITTSMRVKAVRGVGLGSARVSRAGDGVLDIANFGFAGAENGGRGNTRLFRRDAGATQHQNALDPMQNPLTTLTSAAAIR
jgi:hypothetical protein